MSNDNLEPETRTNMVETGMEARTLVSSTPDTSEPSYAGPGDLPATDPPASGPVAIVGIFEDSLAGAQRAFHDLRAVAATPGEVVLLAGDRRLQSNGVDGEDMAAYHVREGGAAGAALGGLLGALLGWMSAIGALAIPGVGASTNGAQLSSTLGGAILGAVAGGLVGMLASMGRPTRNAESDELEDELREGRVLVAVQSSTIPEAEVREIMNARGADDVRVYSGDYSVLNRGAHNRVNNGGRAVTTGPLPLTASLHEETLLMDDSEKGRNLNNVTGTEGAIDPETGAFGTAGTPLTTGYGVSGSTIGTGSVAAEDEHKEGDFLGSTPDQKAYEMGGRSSDDAINTEGGEPDRISVGDVYNASLSDRADIQQEPEERDLYQRGPSYGPDTDINADTDPTEQYSGSAVDESPSYGAVTNEQSQTSAGTDIPGTSDPRGLGDNTDDPNDPD